MHSDAEISVAAPSVKSLRVLHLEAHQEDSEQLRASMAQAGFNLEVVRVDNRADYLTALKECQFDLVLADHTLPGIDGLTALTYAKQKQIEMPFIVVSEVITESVRLELLNQGALDVLIKAEWQQLPRSIKSALREARQRSGRKHAEAALSESEDRFRQLAEHLRQAFWMSNANASRLLFVSPAFEEMWNCKADQLYHQPHSFLACIHPEDRPALEKHFAESDQPQEFQCEFRLVLSSGKVRWIWNRCFPIHDFTGQVHRLIGLAEDITERKEAEGKLKAHSERLSSIFKSFPDLYLLLQPDGTILDYHAGNAEDSLGQPEELLGKPVARILPANVSQQFAEALPRAQKTRELVTIEYSLPNQEGLCFYEARFLPMPRLETFVLVRNITRRIHGEQALRESQRRMAHLIDALPGIVFSSNSGSDWTMTYLSEGVFDLTGYKREELLINGLTYQSITVAEDLPKVSTTMQMALANRQPYLIEYRIRTKSGQERWVWEKGRGVYDQHGQIVGREGFITDIHERKRTEALLSQQSILLRGVAAATHHLLTDSNHDSAIHKALATLGQATHMDRVYVYENPVSLETGDVMLMRWSEWTRDSVLPSIHRSHWHRRSYAELGISRWQELFSQGQPISGSLNSFPPGERELLAGDDIASVMMVPIMVDNALWGFLGFDDCLQERTWSPAEASLLATTAGSIGGLLKSKRSKEELQRAEERYRSIFENAFEGIFQTTPDGYYLNVNPALARMYGYESPAELMANVRNLEHQIYVNPSLRADFKLQMEREGEVRGLEYEIQRKDGQTIWIRENSRAVRAHGKVLYYEGIIEDITERKKSEEALRQSNHQLEAALSELKCTQQKIVQQERLHALGQMSSGIAHDFNNALMAVMGFSELMLTHHDILDNKQKVINYLQTMNTAAKDASNVVKRLSEFYRHREFGEVFPPVQLNKIMTEVVALTQPKWKDQAQSNGVNISIRTHLSEGPPLAGIESELRECLINLVLNAVDAMPRGGVISLCTRTEEEFIVAEVADTGTGMTEEVRKRCLEPFFSTKGQRGTGLGLSMVFGIVQRHQGQIEIDSEVGKGTRFLLKFPVHKSELQNPVPPENPGVTVKPLHILVVDDEPLVREVLYEYLHGDGHTVTTATDGQDALQKYGSKHFDLVLTDKSMPHMTGDRLAAAIKKVNPRKPIILLTGFGEMIKASGRKPDNIDVVMSKPVSLNALRQVLAETVAN